MSFMLISYNILKQKHFLLEINLSNLNGTHPKIAEIFENKKKSRGGQKWFYFFLKKNSKRYEIFQVSII